MGHKTNLNQFKSTEIISSVFSDYNGMKLESTTGKEMRKKQNKKPKQHGTKKPMDQRGN